MDAYVGPRIANVALLFLQYGLSILPLMYLFSFFFTTPSIAFVVMTMFNVITGLAAMITISILQTTDPATGKMYVPSHHPSPCQTNHISTYMLPASSRCPPHHAARF